MKSKLIQLSICFLFLFSCKNKDTSNFPHDVILKELHYESDVVSFTKNGKCSNPKFLGGEDVLNIDKYDYPQKVIVYSANKAGLDWCYNNPNCSNNPSNYYLDSLFKEITIAKKDTLFMFYKDIQMSKKTERFEYDATGDLEKNLNFFGYSYQIISANSYLTAKGYQTINFDTIISKLNIGDTLTYRKFRILYE